VSTDITAPLHCQVCDRNFLITVAYDPHKPLSIGTQLCPGCLSTLDLMPVCEAVLFHLHLAGDR